MRSSSLSTLVCLAVAVMASPTPLDSSSLQARDAWTPPVRRDVFLKRSPVSEPQPEPEIVIDKRSPFTLTRNSIPAVESIDSITTTPSGNGVNARLPFFFKRDGKLQARDVVALEARKAELEQREVEEIARREAEDLVRRDAEDLARREAEDLARREAEEREAREASVLRKRAALEDIEARELELESAKREYEEMYSREYDEIAHFSKREPQFNIASLISQLSGNSSTAGAGGSTNSNSAASRLSALTNGRLGNNAGVSALTSALSRFGFNFRREEESVDDRDFDDAVAYLSKRDPQFNIASLISQLSGNTTAGAGGSTNTNSAASRLSALTNGRLGNLGNTGGASGLTSALSRLGFNFRREEESAAAHEPFDFDSFVNVRRQELSN